MNHGIFNTQIEREIDQLFSSMLLEQKSFQGVKPAREDKKELLRKMISELEKARGRALYFPYLSSGRGHGPFAELIDGSVKYDLICSIGVNLFGHSHPLAIRACLEAATYDSTMCGNLQPYPITTDVSKALISLAALVVFGIFGLPALVDLLTTMHSS